MWVHNILIQQWNMRSKQKLNCDPEIPNFSPTQLKFHNCLSNQNSAKVRRMNTLSQKGKKVVIKQNIRKIISLWLCGRRYSPRKWLLEWLIYCGAYPSWEFLRYELKDKKYNPDSQVVEKYSILENNHTFRRCNIKNCM